MGLLDPNLYQRGGMFKITSLTNSVAKPVWLYQTTDDAATVDQEGYFNKAWQNLERGEKIEVLADFSGDNLSIGYFYVISVSSDAVVVRRHGDWFHAEQVDPGPSPEAREAAIREAIQHLDKKDYTTSGRPDRRVLNSHLDFAVEPDELEIIWSRISAELEEAA